MISGNSIPVYPRLPNPKCARGLHGVGFDVKKYSVAFDTKLLVCHSVPFSSLECPMTRIYPPRKPKKVVGVTLRIREELRRRIESGAKKNDVSLNAEIERRLQSSFELQNTASLIRVLVGGEVTADLLGAIARVFDL